MINLYNKSIVSMSQSDEVWFNLIKTEFEIFMKENKGPYDLPNFFNKVLNITHQKYQYQSEQTTLWNSKDHVVRHFCPVEISIPEFDTTYFKGRYSKERIILLLEDIDDNRNYIFAVETASEGGYKLYLSELKIATILRITYGYGIKNHGP